MPTTKIENNKVRVTHCKFCVCCGEPVPIGEFESLTSTKMCVKCRDAVMAMRNLREGRDNSDDGK